MTAPEGTQLFAIDVTVKLYAVDIIRARAATRSMLEQAGFHGYVERGEHQPNYVLPCGLSVLSAEHDSTPCGRPLNHDGRHFPTPLFGDLKPVKIDDLTPEQLSEMAGDIAYEDFREAQAQREHEAGR